MSYTTAEQSGQVQRIIEALGVQHQGVRKIVITLECGHVPVVEVYVSRLLHDEEADALADHLPGIGALTVTEG